MSFFSAQNPGIGGLEELTNAEEIFLTTFAGLPYNEGDWLRIVSGHPAWTTGGGSGTPTWSYYVTMWSIEPTLNTSITGGDVYDYTLDGVTRYRFVPTIYDANEDAFYTTFSGGLLTGLVASRG